MLLLVATCLRCLCAACYMIATLLPPFPLCWLLALSHLSLLSSSPFSAAPKKGRKVKRQQRQKRQQQHHPWLLAACVRALISILKRLYKIQQATQVACSLGGVVVGAAFTHCPLCGLPEKPPIFLSERLHVSDACPCCCLVSPSLSEIAPRQN